MAEDSATGGSMLFLILLLVLGFFQFVWLLRPEFGLLVRAAWAGILL